MSGDRVIPRRSSDGNYAPACCAADVFAVLDGLGLHREAIVGTVRCTVGERSRTTPSPDSATSPHKAQLILADPPGDLTRVPVEVYEARIVPYQRALETEDWRAAVEASFN